MDSPITLRHELNCATRVIEMLGVQFYSLEDSWTELKECLLKTKLIDWTSRSLVTGVLMENSEVSMNILETFVAKVSRARGCYCVLLLPMDARCLPEPDIPVGYSVTVLMPENIERVHYHWPNKLEGSLEYVKPICLISKAIGVFHKEDNLLVGWIFQNEFSGLGILQVIPEEQRKGFGQILTVKMTKNIASDEDVDITAFYVKEKTRAHC